MIRRTLAVFLCMSMLMVQGFAADRDPDRRSIRGIPTKNRHLWAVLGGAALGAGIGVLAPGGTKSAWKGVIIGGSGASLIYLTKHRNQEGPWAYVLTNTALGLGIGWTACDCGDGVWAGALIGGGGTAVIQSFKTRSKTLAKITGSTPKGAPTPPPSGGTTQPPPPPPPQTTPPQTTPPQNNPPQDQQDQDQEKQQDQGKQQGKDNPPELPDAPQPKDPGNR